MVADGIVKGDIGADGMREIKRILWVDDYPNNTARSLFPAGETKNVATMDEAINEISSDHLYDYDTIVLDIDFENGLPNGETNTVQKLTKRIFLKKDQRNKAFIINNGGYLLFLYLLEKGYPSEQVAFLTGNTGILAQLRNFLQQDEMSKEDIFIEVKQLWEKYSGDFDAFEEKICELPIDENYKTPSFFDDCVDKLIDEDFDGLKILIDGVKPTLVTGTQNTGDMMIFRFHEANLEPPAFFSKNENDLPGHNREDAQKWIEKKRTDDKLVRWLLLYAGNYVESLFQHDLNAMNTQIGGIFRETSVDPGIRSSFRQMYYVFEGLKSTKKSEESRGPYYQAIAAMLIPFDNSPCSSGASANVNNLGYEKVQRAYARFCKQARNYCAHNYFGSAISNNTTAFILAGTLCAILSKEQIAQISPWFVNLINRYSYSNTYSVQDNIIKIDNLYEQLDHAEKIDTISAHVNSLTSYSDFEPWDILRALGYNIDMDDSSQNNSSIRENYFVFTLAAYILKWFEGLNENEIESRFGIAIKNMFVLSNEIVDTYNYGSTF